MADRIEYQGNPLPSGLPGYGGGTVETVVLPGINTVVSPLKFGPTVEAVDATPPSSIPPEGSNPNNPTDQVITPNPVDPAGTSRGLCKDCKTEENVGSFPLMSGLFQTDKCTDCSGNVINVNKYFTIPSGVVDQDFGITAGVYWDSPGSVRGVFPGDSVGQTKKWKITYDKIYLDDANGYLPYTPKTVTVCVDGEPKTWYILAYQVP